MKKILILFLVFISFWFSFTYWAGTWKYTQWDCQFDPISGDIGVGLNGCLGWTDLVKATDASINSWFTPMIQIWINNLSLYLGVFTVLAIVVGSFMMVFSWWEDEKITKAKNTIKWWILWFLWILFASAIVNIIIKIMYSI